MIDDDLDFFTSASAPALTVAVGTSSSWEIVLHPAADLRLLLVADWRDREGRPYYPAVHVQFRAWNDDTVTAWQPLSIDDYAVARDTIVVHCDVLLVVDSRLGGANFTFRARLSSAGVQTDWVRLKESVRFYYRERPGMPRQPSELRLLQ